jgi:hypothetical protein
MKVFGSVSVFRFCGSNDKTVKPAHFPSGKEMEVPTVKIKVGESGDQFFECPVDCIVEDALVDLREEHHFRDGLIYDGGRRLNRKQFFRDQLPRNQDGSLILTDLVYKNGQ